jgi:hypothetical protein
LTDEESELRKSWNAEIDKTRELKETVRVLREALLIMKEYCTSESAIAKANEALGISE